MEHFALFRCSPGQHIARLNHLAGRQQILQHQITRNIEKMPLFESELRLSKADLQIKIIVFCDLRFGTHPLNLRFLLCRS